MFLDNPLFIFVVLKVTLVRFCLHLESRLSNGKGHPLVPLFSTLARLKIDINTCVIDLLVVSFQDFRHCRISSKPFSSQISGCLIQLAILAIQWFQAGVQSIGKRYSPGQLRLIISSWEMPSSCMISDRRLFSCPTIKTVLPSCREGAITLSQYTLERCNVHLSDSDFGILSNICWRQASRRYRVRKCNGCQSNGRVVLGTRTSR